MNKIYLPLQLKALMPPEMFKVMDTIFAFQKEDGIVTYSKRNAEFLHIDQAIADQCIQTAIDKHIITPVGMDGGVYKFKINEGTIEAIKQIPLPEISRKPLLKLSDEIKWKNQTSTKELSNDEILEQIRQLQAMLKKNVTEDLPW